MPNSIDLFRSIVFNMGKQIILSTHDENFQNLLKKKIPIKFNFRTELVGLLLIVFVISVSSAMVLMGTISLGYMIAILSLSTSIGPSLTRIALFNVQLQKAKVAYTRVEEFTSLDKEEQKGEKIEEIVILEAQDVFFNFPGSLPLLQGINFEVKKGIVWIH